MKPEELSRQLREESGQYLARRRSIVGLSLVAIGSMALISLYQMGIIKHLPEPPLPYLDADKVDAAGEAYKWFSTPDAVLGLISYALTMGLAAVGGQNRARERPWIPLLLGGKVVFDAVQAGKLTVDQWIKHRAFCSWCLLATAATFAMIPLMIAELRVALRQIGLLG